MQCGGYTFSIIVGVFQILMLILFAVSVDYGEYDQNTGGNSAPFYYSCKSATSGVHQLIWKSMRYLEDVQDVMKNYTQVSN